MITDYKKMRQNLWLFIATYFTTDIHLTYGDGLLQSLTSFISMKCEKAFSPPVLAAILRTVTHWKNEVTVLPLYHSANVPSLGRAS
jgi:hypothetical protein